MKTITENALIKRINRKLAHEGQQLRKSRPDSRWRNDLGEFYIIDIETKRLECSDVPLGDLGYQLRILADDERVEG